MNWPIFITCFILTAVLVNLVKRPKKHTPPKRTERQKQSDELITVVLPTIKSKD